MNNSFDLEGSIQDTQKSIDTDVLFNLTCGRFSQSIISNFYSEENSVHKAESIKDLQQLRLQKKVQL